MQKGGGVSGIGVAESTVFFVIAGNEGGTGVNAAADIDEAAVDVKAEFGHGVGLVDIERSEEFGPEGAKHILGGNQEAAVVFTASADIQQADEHAFGADADRIVEISADALANEQSGDVGAGDSGKDGRDRLDRLWFGRAGVETGEHKDAPRAKVAQGWGCGNRGGVQFGARGWGHHKN